MKERKVVRGLMAAGLITVLGVAFSVAGLSWSSHSHARPAPAVSTAAAYQMVQ